MNAASARTAQLVLSCVLVLVLTTKSSAQQCPQLDAAFVEPAEEVDAIVVSVDSGRPAFRAFASVDSIGRAFYLPDASDPESASVAALGSSLFTTLLTEAQLAVEANRARLESEPPDTSTLEGLLEALRRGSVGCSAHVDGVDYNVSLHVTGEMTHHTCVSFQLAEFGRYLMDIVRNAAANGGQPLWP
jgi:hypothetical protein